MDYIVDEILDSECGSDGLRRLVERTHFRLVEKDYVWLLDKALVVLVEDNVDLFIDGTAVFAGDEATNCLSDDI